MQVKAFLAVEQLIHLEVLDEGITLLYVLWSVHVSCKKPPKASNEVRDHEDDDNESENLVSVHNNIETLEPISSGRVLIVSLYDPFEPTGIQNGDQL